MSQKGEMAESTQTTIQEAQQAVRSSLLSTMMRRMSSAEADIMAQHWGYIDSKKEPRQEVHSAALEAGIDKRAAPQTEQISPLYDAFLQQQQNDFSAKHLLHSELGELVLELQGKSVYKTSVKNLSRSTVGRGSVSSGPTAREPLPMRRFALPQN